MFGYSLDGRRVLRRGKVIRECATRGDAVAYFAKIIRLCHKLAY